MAGVYKYNVEQSKEEKEKINERYIPLCSITLNKLRGGGIETRPFQKLPLSSRTKFQLHKLLVFVVLHVLNNSVISNLRLL